MPAKDFFHNNVKVALEKDNWIITQDPYPVQIDGLDLAIDLGAERIIAAEKEKQKIAVEIKSFLGASKVTEFYGALGQFIAYRTALQIQEKERILYLAVPSGVYEKFFVTLFIQKIIQENQLYLFTYNIEDEVIEKWIPIL